MSAALDGLREEYDTLEQKWNLLLEAGEEAEAERLGIDLDDLWREIQGEELWGHQDARVRESVGNYLEGA